MPLCPQITLTPITVTSTNMVQTSVVAANVPATTEQLVVTNEAAEAAVAEAAAAIAAAEQAQIDAEAALAEAEAAFTAATGSLQPSANTIVNASNQITAINGNGITVYAGSSPSSGARVVLNSAGLAGFNSGGTATFSVSASTGAAVFSGSVTGATITGGTLNINGNAIINDSGHLIATGATITGHIVATSGTFTGAVFASSGTFTGTVFASSGSFTGSIFSTSGTIGSFSIGANFLSAGGIVLNASNGNATFNAVTANGTLSAAGGISLQGTLSGGANAFNNIGAYSGSTISLTGTLAASGNITANAELFAAGHGTTGNTANGFVFQTGGRVARSTASSRRYKENVTDLWSVPELDPKKLLRVPVRAFMYKQDYLTNDDRSGVLIPGLIAEEVDAIYPLAADYEDGDTENINDRAILVNLLALVQDLYKEIDALKGE